MANVLTIASSDADFIDCGVDRSRLASARSVAQAWVESGETTGLVVAAARRGRIVLHDAFGVLRPDSDTPLSVDAIFPIASISKSIVATATMRLVESGLLGLNRPVQEYVPEFTGEGRQAVAVWHLLTHTSGLDETDAIEPDSMWFGTESNAAVIQMICRLPISAPPGSVFSYSSLAYVLLGEIVRRVSGGSPEVFIQRQILDPLGMRDTGFSVFESAHSQMALRYSAEERRDSERYASELERWIDERAAGGEGISTARDLLIFGQTFLQGGAYGAARVLSPASVRLMTTPQTGDLPLQFDDEIWERASWGYGWHIHASTKGRRGASLYSPSTFEHVGMGGAFLWVDPENEIVGVCLSLLRQGSIGLYPAWRADLLINAIMAAIDV
jgi:CubicO group peptidase (beta-lactamase class C family)